MNPDLSNVFPPFGLSLCCGEVTLSGTTPDHVPDLITAAKEGVYDVDSGLPMPFLFDWPSLPDQDLNMWQHVWSKWGSFSKEQWSLKLSVIVGGRAIGCQDVVNKSSFLVSRSLETGSWLGLKYQGSGIGTRIRQMVAMFCFDHLGAEELTSGYIDGNVKSAGVSRKVGYVDNGFRRLPSDDSYRVERLVRLTPDLLVRPVEPLEVQGVDEFRCFIGLG
ncbi:MAG: GNAT family N-acetyltransferase [Propionibacteriaceae bacterium]